MKQAIPSKDWVAAADSRCAATFIDALFAFPCMLPLSPFVDLTSNAGVPWWGVLAIILISWSILTMFVFAAFECSPLRGTPGKLVCGLAVTTAAGDAISFKTALKRNFVKYGVGFFGVVALTRGKWGAGAAIHDAAAQTIVVPVKRYFT